MPSPSPGNPTLDLNIRVGRLSEGFYPILATSTALPTSATSQIAQAEVAEKLRSPVAGLDNGDLRDEAGLKQLGTLNFAALFSGPVRDAYRQLQGKRLGSQRLRILLNIEDQQLQQLPWELIYDPWLEVFLGDVSESAILRFVESPRQPVRLAPPSQLTVKVLVAIAQPGNQPPIEPEQERNAIRAALSGEIERGRIKLDFVGGQTSEIRRALDKNDPDIFQIISHGEVRGEVPGLWLEGPNGPLFANPNLLLNDVFPDDLPSLRLIVLSACQTAQVPSTAGYRGLAYELARRFDSVIAMQYPIGPDSARAFTQRLYEGLALPEPVDAAFTAARRSIHTGRPATQRDWIAPVLVTRGEIFEMTQRWEPFKGAIPYAAGDRRLFRGREAAAERLVELVQQRPVVIVSGPSTAGKTSLLLAGFLAATAAERPVAYVEVAADLDGRLRERVGQLLRDNRQPALPDGEWAALTGQLPRNMVLILDRVEQADSLGPAIQQILQALIDWALRDGAAQRGGRLILGTRSDDEGKLPAFVRARVPEWPAAQLPIEMLDRDAIARVIDEVTASTPVTFTPPAITRVLEDLEYEQRPNMMAVQIVCRALYRRASDLRRAEIAPELLDDGALQGVAGILRREFEIAPKLQSATYGGGDLARLVLAQFVRADRSSARPVSRAALELRVAAPGGGLGRVLDQLIEDGILTTDRVQGEEYYELAHEALAAQIDWVEPASQRLREYEELVESARGQLPLPDLIKLSQVGDQLKLLPNQQALLLRSALEANYSDPAERDQWFERFHDPGQALETLTDHQLSALARERATGYLARLAQSADQNFARLVRSSLLSLAQHDEAPAVRRAASLAVAPTLPPGELADHFGGRGAALDPPAIEAIARIYDQSGQSLARFDAGTRRQVRWTLWRLSAPDVLTAVFKTGIAGAGGFALVAMFDWWRNVLLLGATPVLEIATVLVGLLALVLAFPGACLAPLGLNLAALLNGGRRRRHAAWGVVLGSALGAGLSFLLVIALARMKSDTRAIASVFDWPSLGGVLLGLAISAAWLPALLGGGWRWVGLLGATVAGALAASRLYAVDLWPAESLVLSPQQPPHILIIGGALGLALALGLAWSRRPPQLTR